MCTSLDSRMINNVFGGFIDLIFINDSKYLANNETEREIIQNENCFLLKVDYNQNVLKLKSKPYKPEILKYNRYLIGHGPDLIIYNDCEKGRYSFSSSNNYFYGPFPSYTDEA